MNFREIRTEVILATPAPGDLGEGCFNEMRRTWGQKLDWTKFKSEGKVKEI